jgi:hypothetical protein
MWRNIQLCHSFDNIARPKVLDDTAVKTYEQVTVPWSSKPDVVRCGQGHPYETAGPTSWSQFCNTLPPKNQAKMAWRKSEDKFTEYFQDHSQNIAVERLAVLEVPRQNFGPKPGYPE